MAEASSPAAPGVQPKEDRTAIKLERELAKKGLRLADLEAKKHKAVLSEGGKARLAALPETLRRAQHPTLDPLTVGDWPKLSGLLAIFYTKRSGSSFLAREISCRYDIGVVDETLNAARLRECAATSVIEAYRGQWFGVKLDVPAIFAAEYAGVIDHYFDRLRAIFLLRKDIVAEAISLDKARQTAVYRSYLTAKTAPAYSEEGMTRAIRGIHQSVSRLSSYISALARPTSVLFYEEFAGGDLTSVFDICDKVGIPRLDSGSKPALNKHQKTSDSTNEEWRARFHASASEKDRKLVAEYVEMVRKLG